jgi:hypothetical protein
MAQCSQERALKTDNQSKIWFIRFKHPFSPFDGKLDHHPHKPLAASQRIATQVQIRFQYQLG